MSSNKKKSRSEKTNKAFGLFTRFITEQFVEKFGKSYMTVENVGNKWRTQVDYSIEAEHFLIEKSKLFLRMLDTKDSDNLNPQFLCSVIKSMADYLSKYTMRALIPANSKDCDEKQARKEAERFLFEVLYINNSYIKNLLEKSHRKHQGESEVHNVQKQYKLRPRKNKQTANVVQQVTNIQIFVVGGMNQRKK